MNIKDWWIKNKVYVVGFLTTALLTISELIKGGEGSVKVYVVCAIIAAMTWLGKNLRGQTATILVILANGIAAWYAAYKTGTVDYLQLLISITLSYLGLTAGPLKSVGYEKTQTIVDAKHEGETIQPSVAPTNQFNPDA